MKQASNSRLRLRRIHVMSGATVTAVGALLFAVAAFAVPSDTYVALGDSYVAGPLVPLQTGTPASCQRSNHNYASLVAPTLATTRFVDSSCSGATTADLFAAQGDNPPQLDSIDSRTSVVTIGIGGNDIGFTGIAVECVSFTPLDTPCRDVYVTAAGDELRNRIAATEPKVDAVLQGIVDRAPQAKVFVVGYPTILPETGGGCYPVQPILDVDVVYLRGIVKTLNAMLAHAAATNGATYIDIATTSIGHDICSLENWVNGVFPTSPGAPVHPNAVGFAASAIVIGPILRAAASSPPTTTTTTTPSTTTSTSTTTTSSTSTTTSTIVPGALASTNTAGSTTAPVGNGAVPTTGPTAARPTSTGPTTTSTSLAAGSTPAVGSTTTSSLVALARPPASGESTSQGPTAADVAVLGISASAGPTGTTDSGALPRTGQDLSALLLLAGLLLGSGALLVASARRRTT